MREDSRIVRRGLLVDNVAVKEGTLHLCGRLAHLSDVVTSKTEENERAARIRHLTLIPLILIFLALALKAAQLLS